MISAGEHAMLSAKRFFQAYLAAKPEEKRNELGKKTEFYRMGFSASGNDSDRMDELLSDDSGIYPVFADRYGH